MPTPGAKNFSLTPAAKDLGLGDMVQMQLDDDLEERKKKLLQAQQGGGVGASLMSGMGSMNMGGAASALFGSAGGLGA